MGMIAGPLGEARNAAGLARAAEDAGFELLGLGDNQSLWRDVYVSLTLAAAATSKIRLGPTVTNIVTRSLAVTASAIASVDEVSGGRAFLGLGPGDSAVLNVGAKPARLADLERGVTAIQTMLAGGSIAGENPMHVRWSNRRVPIYLAAEGPRALEMAGRVADGIFVSYGLSAAAVGDSEELIGAGAAAAGRNVDEIDIWHAARISVADTQAEAIRGARTAMASVAHHALRLSPETRGVPQELLPALKELNERYRPAEHADFGDSANARLVDELGLMPYLMDRYAIAGTAEQCAQRLSDLRGFGIQRLLLMFAGPDLEAQVKRWAKDVVPLAVAGGFADATSS
jgi:5,10-methylenetetrahydromethanopterin reductase